MCPALAAGVLVLLCAPGVLRAQVDLTSGASEIDLSGRFQLQTATTSCSDVPFEANSPCTEQAPGIDAFVRRARLTVSVTVDDRIDGRIEPDFGDVSGVTLKNAWGRLTFGEGARLRIGQFKKPFDGFQLTSSSRLLAIERDLDVPGVPGLRAASLDELTTRSRISGYDIGVMLHGQPAQGFSYWIGGFNGEPGDFDGDRNTDKQLVARAQGRLTVGSLPLTVAAAGAITDLPFTRPDGSRGGEHFTNAELWAELGDFAGGPHLQAGLVLGENPLQDPAGDVPEPIPDAFASMVAWQVIGAHRWPVPGGGLVEAVEPSLRVTHADPNTDLDDDEVLGLTPGVNVHFGGRNKVQIGWDIVTFAGDFETVSSFKTQYQLYF